MAAAIVVSILLSSLLLPFTPLLSSLCLPVSVSLPAANKEQYESPLCAKRLQQQPTRQEGGGREELKRVTRPETEERVNF